MWSIKDVSGSRHGRPLRLSRVLWCLAALGAAGCATPPATPSSEASLAEPVGAVSLTQVRDAPRRYLDRPLRWSGSVVGTIDTPAGPRTEVIAKPTDRSGRPLLEQPALGRFLIAVPPRLEPIPDHYAIAVVGRVRGTRLIRTPQLYYLAPEIDADEVQLWHPAQLSPDYAGGVRGAGYRPTLRVLPHVSVGIGYGRSGGWRGGYGIGFSVFP